MTRAPSILILTVAAWLIVTAAVATPEAGAPKIAAGTITATEIATATITATNIAAGTITADKLDIDSLSAITADLGTVTAGEIFMSSGGNRIWFNDDADGTIRVGGTNKGSAPFTVNADGELHAAYVNADTLVVDGNITLFFTTTGSGNRYLCVSSTGVVFDSGTPCA